MSLVIALEANVSGYVPSPVDNQSFATVFSVGRLVAGN